jgi:hypothetical protein
MLLNQTFTGVRAGRIGSEILLNAENFWEGQGWKGIIHLQQITHFKKQQKAARVVFTFLLN